MKVMVKEANKFSTDVEYPQNTKQSNEDSAQIRLPQELFAKYKGKASFVNNVHEITRHAHWKLIDKCFF